MKANLANQIGRQDTNNSVYRAFTLIELLVAITIIALLMGLMVAGIGNILGSSREAATRTTLKKVHEILKQKQDEFNLARNTSPPPRHNEPCLPGASETLTDILHWKRLHRETFPQRYADLFNMQGRLTAIGRKVESIATTMLAQELGTTPTPAQVEEHIRDVMLAQNGSAELLYLILTEGSSYGVSSSDSDQFSVNEAKDTDGDGLMEIVDGWGNPVRFYRWPTRMIRPCDPNNVTTPLAIDPVRGNLPAVNMTYWKLLASANLSLDVLGRDNDDPLSWLSKSVGTNLNNIELNSSNTCNFHTPDTYAPLLVVSMGADQELGLYEPNDTSNYGHLAQPAVRPENALDSALNDNITNLQGLE